MSGERRPVQWMIRLQTSLAISYLTLRTFLVSCRLLAQVASHDQLPRLLVRLLLTTFLVLLETVHNVLQQKITLHVLDVTSAYAEFFLAVWACIVYLGFVFGGSWYSAVEMQKETVSAEVMLTLEGDGVVV